MAQDFVDTEFSPGDWTAIVLDDEDGVFSFLESQVGGGGNPGAYRQFVHVTSTGDGANDGPDVVLGHLRNGATWDPGTQGAVERISCGLDGRVFSTTTSGDAIAFRILLRQSGTVFVGPVGVVLLANGWLTISQPDLDASDFENLESWTVGGSIENPDFSGEGDVMEFGFVTANGTTQFEAMHNIGGVDNWFVSIQALGAVDVPESVRSSSWGGVKAGYR